MWVQFHVRRKSIPCTAARATCTASMAAFGGNAAAARKLFAKA
jgi:hypothetical protein